MTSDFEAPDGPASSMPPPPPGAGPIPPPPPTTATPPPPPGAGQIPPSPPAGTTPPPPPTTATPPSPPAGTTPPVPPPPPASAATPPAPVERVETAPEQFRRTASADNSSDLADILARLDEPIAEQGDAAAGATSTAEPTRRDSAPVVGDHLTDPRDLERPSRASGIVIESEGGLDFDPTFAPFGKRAVELIVDSIILTVCVIPGFVLLLLGGALAGLGALVLVLGFVAFTVLTARSIAASGQSTGNRVADTRIVDGINGSNIDVGRAALRVVVRHLISIIFLFGFLIAFTDGQRRTFHDRLARTVVIGRERDVWTAGDHGS